jgi:hypothetical protein
MARGAGMPWLVDGGDNPLPPPSVVAGLKEINPRLGLNYHKALHAFMVTLQWHEDDERRQMIRDGVMSPDADFEILCPVPADVSFDELRGWLESQLVRVANTREDVKRMVADHEARIAKQNAGVVQAKADEAADQFIEAVANPAPAHGRRRTRIA